jgi:L-lactate dehydrogenase (cytochrome)
MKLDRVLNIADLRQLAQRRLPRMVFDYIDGGADDEITLAANVARLRARQLVWDALVNVDAIDGRTRVLGGDMRLPFFISPTAASRLFHTSGECAVARAAGKAGIAYSLSTMGSATIEDVARATAGPKHFQVYVWKDRGLVREVLARAKAAGFTAAILTVDVPVAGNRERDPRNAFTIPPKPSLATATQVLARPVWLADLVRSRPIRPENFSSVDAALDGGIMAFINDQFDRTVTWADAAWMVDQWGGPFAVKGVATPADARRCVEIGASCVWVSNHGGRQLDSAPATIDLLEPIAQTLAGDAEIVFDGGIRRGGDIVKARALGATACAIGRAYLWGLAAAGEAGVSRAIDILESEWRRTMALLGAPTNAAIRRDMTIP